MIFYMYTIGTIIMDFAVIVKRLNIKIRLKCLKM